MLLQEGCSLLGDGVLVLLQILAENLVEVFSRIVGEVDIAVEARLKTWVGVDEFLHLVGVTCHDDYQSVAIVLHALEQGGNSLLTIVGTGITLGDGIGLVDEEYTAKG